MYLNQGVKGLTVIRDLDGTIPPQAPFERYYCSPGLY